MNRDEFVNEQRIRCYDNGGKTFDRYTVVYMDEPYSNGGLRCCVGMSDRPFHPQGFGQYSGCQVGGHLGKRIKFAELPKDCRKRVEQDTKPQAVASEGGRDVNAADIGTYTDADYGIETED